LQRAGQVGPVLLARRESLRGHGLGYSFGHGRGHGVGQRCLERQRVFGVRVGQARGVGGSGCLGSLGSGLGGSLGGGLGSSGARLTELEGMPRTRSR
jgi:hypothetical protein